MTEIISNSGEKGVTYTKEQIERWWNIIKSTGCPEIQDAIRGR
ncbi:MAG: hypothetical protein Fur009_3520 [Candidatus Microgenomates bacterium]